LEFFGYVNNDRGQYIYHLPRSDRERENRQNGVNEFLKFFDDLKNAERKSLKGFEQFIQVKLLVNTQKISFCICSLQDSGTNSYADDNSECENFLKIIYINNYLIFS
jgi:hypothetical protein